MDIGIYARPDYYFGYDDPVMRALLAGVEATADPAEQAEILRAAQERVASHFVNAFLFQLPKTGVADARLRGLWANSPTQANDMTAVYWAMNADAGGRRACSALLPAQRRAIVLRSGFSASLVAQPRSSSSRSRSSPATRRATCSASTPARRPWPRSAPSSASTPARRRATSPGSAGCCTGDFGISYTYRTPVAGMVARPPRRSRSRSRSWRWRSPPSSPSRSASGPPPAAAPPSTPASWARPSSASPSRTSGSPCSSSSSSR